MRRISLGLCLIGAFLLSACAHQVIDTNQFYVAQSYLPLLKISNTAPDSATSEAEAVKSSADTTWECKPGGVYGHERVPTQRNETEILPGMTLRVSQTDYRATGSDSAPILSEWTWHVPKTGNACDDQGARLDEAARTPVWNRRDLLIVRQLLSAAQFRQGAQKPDFSPDYFEKAIAADCLTQSAEPGDLACAQKFLDEFVKHLVMRTRAQTLYSPLPDPISGPGFNPDVPREVIAEDGARVSETTGLAHWYAGLTRFRWNADLFPGGQGDACSKALSDTDPDNPAVLPRDAEVCRFPLQSLVLKSHNLPGQLGKLSELVLLNSGDPLLLFQPQPSTKPLDVGAGQRCPKVCPLNRRTTLGFTDLEALIPVTIQGEKDEVLVPVGMTALEFARDRHGLCAVRRALKWLPTNIKYRKSTAGGPSSSGTIPAKALAGGRDKLTIVFDKSVSAVVGCSLEQNAGRNVIAFDLELSAPDDFVLAPGDVLVLSRR